MQLKLPDVDYVPFYKRISYLYIPALFVLTTILMEVLMFAIMGLSFPSSYIFSLTIVLIIATITSLIGVKWVQTVICSILIGAQVFFTISNVIAYQTGNGVFSLETFLILSTAFKNKDAVSLDLLFLIPLIILVVAYIVALVLIMWFCPMEKKQRRFEKQSLLCGILAFVSFFVYTFTYSTLPSYGNNFVLNLSNQKFTYDTLSNRVGKMRTFGSYSYYLDNLLAILGGKKDVIKVLDIELEEEFKPNQFALDEAEVLGEGYNLISILMETFERQAINPITMPNLYKFMQESCTEVNGYYSIERTCFADHISQTGTHPEGGEFWLNYSDVQLPHALPNIFNQSGYKTATFHNSHGSCYERNDFFERTMGFQEFNNYYTYGDDSTRHAEQYAFNSDELLIKANLPKIMPSDRDFYSYIISISTHITDAKKYSLRTYYPEEFEFIENEKWDELTELYPVLLSEDPIQVLTAKNYLAGTCSFDKGFGALIEYLKTTKDETDDQGRYLIETTAIVMFGDHYYYATPDTLKAENEDPYNLAGNRCAFIVYNPREQVTHPTLGNLTQGENALLATPAKCGSTLCRFTSTMDIYPTICSLFGIQTDQQLTYGRSIFGTEKSIGVAYLSGYIFGDVGYDAVNDEWKLWRTYNFEKYNGVKLTQKQLAEITPIVNRVYDSIFMNTKLYETDGFKDLAKAYYKLGSSN